MRLQEPADRSDVIRELGDLDDNTRQAIVALGPTVADLVEARAWLFGTAGEREHGSPAPVVRRIVHAVRSASLRPV